MQMMKKMRANVVRRTKWKRKAMMMLPSVMRKSFAEGGMAFGAVPQLSRAILCN